MRSSSQSQAESARRLLRPAAWVLLVAVILSGIAAIPGVRDWLVEMDRYAAFDIAHRAVPVIAALAGVIAWLAALWHAIVDPERHILPKPLIVLLLVFGNVIGAFLYYFLFLHWLERFTRPVTSVR
jgi:cytochrome bd-type quinol oxidase subunit 2